jgi:hypothetical protein
MRYLEEYKRKLVTADEAVKVVKSGDWLDYGTFMGTGGGTGQGPGPPQGRTL